MANIIFNNKDFLIDESAIAPSSAELKSHLTSVMNGSGATIEFGGIEYGVDSTKLSAATNEFIAHLATIAGEGLTVVVGGVQYNVDPNKLSVAISELEGTFSNLGNGAPVASEGLEYSLMYDGTYGVSGIGTCTDTNIIIPSDIYGSAVTQIKTGAFSGCAGLTSVSIPYGVTGIGEGAFQGCKALEHITIPGSVTRIEDYAFYGCASMTSIVIPDSVTSISYDAFDGCTGLAIIYFEAQLPPVNFDENFVGSNCTVVYGCNIETPVASSFDNTGDGVAETYTFLKMLPAHFTTTEAIHIDAVKDITDNNGVYQEPGRSSHYVKYDELEAGTGTMPYAHVYCDTSAQYLRYSFYVPEDGIYDLAAHLRIKDEVIRGATYTINKGTDYEYAFVTTYGWKSAAEALAVRNNDFLQGAYMTGMSVRLQKGTNTIHITLANSIAKAQHFRDFYLIKTADIPTEDITTLSMDEAEAIGIVLGSGVILPEYRNITVAFNNGGPRETDGFCRVITSNGNKMSIQKITLDDNQIMPTANSIVVLRGKIGCVKSAVNGSIGKETRIFDAIIVDIIDIARDRAGLYETGSNYTVMTKSWGELFNDGYVNIYDGAIYTKFLNDGAGTNESASVLVGDLVLPDNNTITKIDFGAFYNCRNMTGIEIPSSVTSIGGVAFNGCISLTSITFKGTVAQWNAISKSDDLNNGEWKHNVPATYVQCSDGQVAL